MIGVFDSGLGGLTILRALKARFPAQAFVYLGDQANAPFGDRASAEIVAFTRAGVAHLFARGARLVVLGCNTATAVALRTLQRDWLPKSGYAGVNVLGIVAPTVEAATQTPFSSTTPQYPQKNNREILGVFGTTRTIASGVYPEEIWKRCPRATVVQQACPELAAIVAAAVDAMQAQLGPRRLDRAILGCTHFPIVEELFAARLPAGARILSQPEVVADSLEDYLVRHPEYAGDGASGLHLFTTGDPEAVSRAASIFWPAAGRFESAHS